MVERIGIESLKQLKKGKLTANATCIVKFYSHNCHFCHSLKDYFIDVAESYEDREDLFFFAFNVDDVEQIENIININGVPTIASFRGGPQRKVKIKILDDPDPPHKKTWYFVKDIKKFIESSS
jgi:thiol-disulfide isomerase/thioredoxin